MMNYNLQSKSQIANTRPRRLTNSVSENVANMWKIPSDTTLTALQLRKLRLMQPKSITRVFTDSKTHKYKITVIMESVREANRKFRQLSTSNKQQQKVSTSKTSVTLPAAQGTNSKTNVKSHDLKQHKQTYFLMNFIELYRNYGIKCLQNLLAGASISNQLKIDIANVILHS